MGNRRNIKSRRLDTPSSDREVEVTQVETPNTGSGTLTNIKNVVQEYLGENNSENQLTESTQISNEIQTWTK